VVVSSTLPGMIEFFFAGLPIAVLVVLMTKPNPLPAPIAFFWRLSVLLLFGSSISVQQWRS
jgi:hypothetical protein